MPCPRSTPRRTSSSRIWTPSSTRVAPRRIARQICSGANASGRVSTVRPTHRCSEVSLSLWASSSVEESRPFMASKHLRTNHSWYSGSLLVKVPPMIIRSILSVLWPISVSCVTLSVTCIHGSNPFLPALRAAGSFPV